MFLFSSWMAHEFKGHSTYSWCEIRGLWNMNTSRMWIFIFTNNSIKVYINKHIIFIILNTRTIQNKSNQLSIFQVSTIKEPVYHVCKGSICSSMKIVIPSCKQNPAKGMFTQKTWVDIWRSDGQILSDLFWFGVDGWRLLVEDCTLGLFLGISILSCDELLLRIRGVSTQAHTVNLPFKMTAEKWSPFFPISSVQAIQNKQKNSSVFYTLKA